MTNIRTPVTRRAAYYGLALMTLLNFVNYIDRAVMPAVLYPVSQELHLNGTEEGLLLSAFLWVYFLTSPIFGPLGDRFSRTRLMAIGVGAWSLATAAGGMARTFTQMLVARGAVGVGEAGYATMSPALISDYFPKVQRGRAFSVFYTAIPVGTAAGMVLGGLIAAAHGWRWAFFMVGLPGVALAALTLTAPDPPRGVYDEGEGDSTVAVPLKQAIGALARNRLYVWTVAGYAAYTFALGGMYGWTPYFLQSVHHMDLESANLLVGVISMITGIVGTFAGGYLGDWLERRMRHGYLYLSGVSMVLAVPFAWLALSHADRTVLIVTLFLAEFLAFLSTGPINVVIVNAVPVSIRATAVAVSIFAIHLLGDAAAPALLGVMKDSIGLAKAVLIVPVAVALSGLIWTAAAWGLRGEERGERKEDGDTDRNKER
jgi:MFS transporter, Spinster family, sphingosine-1-phosphate transporter